MKTCLFILLAICIPVYSQAQSAVADTIGDTDLSVKSKPYEIAYTGATWNANNELMFSHPGETSLELLNGLLVRYKFNALSLRFNASFFENTSSSPPEYYYVNGRAGQSNAKNFKIGAGLQWTPFPKKEFLYVFTDCNYKLRRENSIIPGVMPGSSNLETHAKIQGLDLVGGLGTKLRLYKSFYFSMEAGYNPFIAESKKQTIRIPTRQSTGETEPYHFSTFLLRFYLSVVF